MRIVADIETDNLLDELTKIHCLCYYDIDTQESVSLTNYDDIIALMSRDDLTFICHNCVRFDIPAMEKVLGIIIKATKIDTLALSWYLSPEKKIHGLEAWGEEFGVPKPVVTDWQNLTVEEYIFRCQEDVKINTILFELQVEKLKKIYTNGGIDRLFAYLTFKLECAREQEEVKWKLDIDKCQQTLGKLEGDKIIKIENLIAAMPENVKYGKVSKPNKLNIKDGSVSAQGEKWYYLLGKMGLPMDHNEDVTIEILREPGNPGSGQQLKRWLFDLGWVPQEFKYVKEEDPETHRSYNRKIPQVNTPDDGMCPSIKLLFEKEPRLENLESLFVLSHRIGILKGWLRDVDDNGSLKAEIAGLTNTLRFQHKTLVNIPTIHKPYGKELRGCLIAPDENHILCGSDVSGLEDSTKHHYMMYYDPEYVNEQRKPGYDPHISVAVSGDMLTKDEEEFYKWYKSKK